MERISELWSLLFSKPALNPIDELALGFRRIFFVIGLALFLAVLNNTIDPKPPLSNADVYTGVLTYAKNGRGTTYVTVNTPSGIIYTRSHLTSTFLNELQEYIGEEVKIWVYTGIGPFFTPEIKLMQIEVLGEKLMNHWEPGKRLEKGGVRPILMVFGLLMMFLSFRSIKSLTTRRRD